MDAEGWRAAKGVLAEALACPPAERDALLAARCPDPDMRREVQAYLNEYDEDFLESVISVAGTIDSTNASGEAEQVPDIKSGDRIGPYVVLERLGVGGMGHVFLGNDTRLHRKVALKCLSASASATELRSRILHEARAAARITHPHIAIVHDVIEHEDRPFLVMEYVEGENLAALIKRERPSTDKIVDFIRQLASALAAAHAKGIVHRDLKPANIQVTPDGSAKILDFGVAHAMSAAASVTTATSSAGADLTVTVSMGTQADRRVMHPGTPAYMSPEQMFGREIDQRSDIYSLGVIVYEMATGHRPYATDDPLEIVLTLSRDFVTAGGATAPKLPTQLNDIVSRMLAVRPDDRFQTAGELENALVALTVRESVLESSPSRSRTSVALRAAGRIAIVVLTAVAGVTLLGFVATSSFNFTLGRVAPFDEESLLVWPRFGLMALVVPSVYTVGLLTVVAAMKFVVRMASLSRNIEHLVTTGRTRTLKLGARLGLDDPAILSQAVAGIGIIVMALTIRHFWPFMKAFGTSSISTQPAARFLPLQPVGAARLDAQLYQLVFTVLMCAFGFALLRIHRLRARRAVRDGGVALGLVGVMFVLAILTEVLPYRTVWKNEMPVYDVAGERCFAIGQSRDELLLHCPDRTPPRNRIVKRDDGSVRSTGLVQNIFTPQETTHR